MSDIATIGHNNPPEPIDRHVPPVMPGAILCTIPQAGALVARGQTWVYHAIATGQIRAVKSDGRTLVIIESLHEYAAGLPPARVKPHPAFRKRA
jgi:hypothetical protein